MSEKKSRGILVQLPGSRPGASPRNGLPESPGYVYRGMVSLADELPYECAGRCGRRTDNIGTWRDGLCATCREPQCKANGKLIS